MAVSSYNTDPSKNTTISGINIAEGCPPSGINNAIRQLMADVKTESNTQTSKVNAVASDLETQTSDLSEKLAQVEQNLEDTSTTLSLTMTGAKSSAAGKAGLVPAPAKGKQNKPLRGDGTWADYLDCTVAALHEDSGSGLTAQGIRTELDKLFPKTGGVIDGDVQVGGSALYLGSSENYRALLRNDGDSFYILLVPPNEMAFNELRPLRINFQTGALEGTSPDINDFSQKIPTTHWCRTAISTFAVTNMDFFSGTGAFSKALPAGGTWKCILIYNEAKSFLSRDIAGGSNWSENPGNVTYCAFVFRTTI